MKEWEVPHHDAPAEARLGRLQGFFDPLQRRLLERLQALDALAGELIRYDVQAYLKHPRST
ncbi:MAG: hypothetical protein HY673_07430, partial [Chloroflexi bacterium]|nr:hypothetical protein [Chloroflexota bacterium]